MVSNEKTFWLTIQSSIIEIAGINFFFNIFFLKYYNYMQDLILKYINWYKYFFSRPLKKKKKKKKNVCLYYLSSNVIDVFIISYTIITSILHFFIIKFKDQHCFSKTYGYTLISYGRKKKNPYLLKYQYRIWSFFLE